MSTKSFFFLSSLSLFIFCLFGLNDLIAAPPVDIKPTESNKEIQNQKNQEVKKVKRNRFFKKSKKKKWFRFFKKQKEKEYKIKDKWLRISVKILIWSVIIFLVSMIGWLIAFSYPDTFIGNFYITFLLLWGAALYIGLAALLSTILALIF